MLGSSKQGESGRKLSGTTSSVLSQVNQLVIQGLRQAAIDLLEEAVSDAPNDTSLLSTLGRVYLLDRQPDKAVIYLRRSLAQTNSNPVVEDDYSPEAFTDADAEYLEQRADERSNEEFSILDDADDAAPVDRTQELKSRTLHLNRSRSNQGEEAAPKGTEPKITVIKNGRKAVETSPQTNPEEDASLLSENEPSLFEDPSEQEVATERGEIEVKRPREVLPLKPDAAPPSKPEDAIVPHAPKLVDDPEAEQLTISYDDDLDGGEEDVDLSPIESGNLDFVELDEDEDLDDDLDEIGPGTDLIENASLADDFISEDFGWEDLDYFEEDASRENEDEELAQTGLTRAERARQTAVEVLNRVGWDRKYLMLLETTFVESGWGAARVAIEDQIERGAVPEEIMLARQVRSIWFNNEHLWTSFRMKSNAPFMQAEAVYKNFSWADALRLIRCFPSVPDQEEVESFIDYVYDEWYSNDRLRRHFKAFLKYFRYRIIATKRTLPGDVGFLFSSPIEAEWGAENPELLSPISQMRSELREIGADSGFEMPGTENQFKILPKEAFDDKKESK